MSRASWITILCFPNFSTCRLEPSHCPETKVFLDETPCSLVDRYQTTRRHMPEACCCESLRPQYNTVYLTEYNSPWGGHSNLTKARWRVKSPTEYSTAQNKAYQRLRLTPDLSTSVTSCSANVNGTKQVQAWTEGMSETGAIHDNWIQTKHRFHNCNLLTSILAGIWDFLCVLKPENISFLLAHALSEV